MTSALSEDVCFGGFKKRTKCFLHWLQYCSCLTRLTAEQNKGVGLASLLLYGSFETCNKKYNILNSRNVLVLVYIYGQTVSDFAWGRFKWISFLWDVGTVKVNKYLTVHIVVKSQSNSLLMKDDKYLHINWQTCCLCFSTAVHLQLYTPKTFLLTCAISATH